jgi:hypothetical protein
MQPPVYAEGSSITKLIILRSKEYVKARNIEDRCFLSGLRGVMKRTVRVSGKGTTGSRTKGKPDRALRASSW